MENTYWYRHFLVCNKLANKMLGHLPQNFALLLLEQANGRYMNSQMTCYFIEADNCLSELCANDAEMMWEELDMEEISQLSVEQLEADYKSFCFGKLKMEFDNE